jgi:uncharacterized membrane protein
VSRAARGLRLALSAATALYPFLLLAVMARLDVARLPLFQLVPAALTLLVCVRFARTLRPGAVPQIEQFARAIETRPLPAVMVAWARGVTWAWVVFLAINTILCVVLALAAPARWWALWTGAGTYVAMGLLLAGEAVLRKVRFRWFYGGWLDRAFSRDVPPRPPLD